MLTNVMILKKNIICIYTLTLFIVHTTSSIAQISNAELVNLETNITIKNGKLLKTFVYEIKINNRAGEKFTKVSIPYSKMSKASKIDAEIKDKFGQIVKKLKKDEITERSAISDISLYEDDYIKEFTLKHNIYPYTIFYTYQIQEEEFLYIDYWIPVLDQKTPTQYAKLSIEAPIDYKLSYKSQFIDKFKIDSISSKKIYTWETSYKSFAETEEFSPSIYDLIPSVVIVPINFKYDLSGSFKNWKEYGNWQNELLKDLSDLPQFEKDKISSLIVGIDNEIEKIKKLYSYLQDETRYINISIETGGLKPYPASYVAENKYGDCKALTNYFKSVLSFIDIESFYANVNAREHDHS